MGITGVLTLLIAIIASDLCTAKGEPVDTNLQVLQDLQVDVTETNTIVVLATKQNKPLPNSNPPVVTDHGSFLQIELANTLAAFPGKFYPGKGAYIKKMAAFQATETTAAVRIFTDHPAELLGALTVDPLGEKTLFFFEHQALEEVGILHHQAPDPTLESPTAEEVIANTEVEASIADPAAQILDNATSSSFKQKFTAAAVFLAILFLVGFGILALMKRGRIPSKSNQDALIKNMAVYHLSPKEKVTLLKIADRQVLLAVDGQGVKFLATLDKDTPHSSEPMMATQKAHAVSPRQFPSPPTKPPKPPAMKQQLPQSTSAKPAAPDTLEPKQKLSQNKEAIEDVTKLIRRKLKDLPTLT